MRSKISLTGPFRFSTALIFTPLPVFRVVINNSLNHAEEILELSVRLIAPFHLFSPSFVHSFLLPSKLFAMSEEKVSDLAELLPHLIVALEISVGFILTSHFLVMVTLLSLTIQ